MTPKNMPAVPKPAADREAAEALAVLDQMYGYFSFEIAEPAKLRRAA
ncbi:MAG: hypothetical protein QM682_11450 [Paracoccus sp. (in: a-proteobacteria)]